MKTIRVEVLPGGKQVREINLVRKPVVGFYDFHDEYDVQAFEKAKAIWLEAENKLRTFDVIQVGDKPYPFIAGGIEFWHLTESKQYDIVIISENKAKIILYPEVMPIPENPPTSKEVKE
jgi:hypothetical protein